MGRRHRETLEEYGLRLERQRAALRIAMACLPINGGLRLERQRAEDHDARMNEPMTRGAVLEAINEVIFARCGNVGDHHEAVMAALEAMREAFE